MADGGGDRSLWVGFYRMEVARAQRGGRNFRPEVCLIGKQDSSGTVAGGGGTDDVGAGFPNIRRREFDANVTGINRAIPTHLKVEDGGGQRGEPAGGGRGEFGLPRGCRVDQRS